VNLSEDYEEIPGRGKYHKSNKMNNLTSNEWLKFQKSWFILNPGPRKEDVLLHPAKFPEELITQFIEFFTKEGQVVLDPMAGTGSTLVAALKSKRSVIGVELLEKYAEIADKRAGDAIKEVTTSALEPSLFYDVYCKDANELADLELPKIDYCITSPPYWDMLHAEGFETQKKRKAKQYDVKYSDNPEDLGNIHDYEEFLTALLAVYENVYHKLKDRGYLTVIVKNVKKGGKIYPLAWDLAKELDGLYLLKDEKIWCQDNQKLAPYGYKNAWVSNTMHHYCLNFRKE
jgi:DNA modification methylase